MHLLRESETRRRAEICSFFVIFAPFADVPLVKAGTLFGSNLSKKGFKKGYFGWTGVGEETKESVSFMNTDRVITSGIHSVPLRFGP
jgi:hypothetical protein